MRQTTRAQYYVPISATHFVKQKPTSLSINISLAESITTLLEKPSEMNKLGDKATMLPLKFTFSVICIM